MHLRLIFMEEGKEQRGGEWRERCGVADRGMERWQNHYGNALSVALFLSLISKLKSEPSDCCFPGCSDSHRRHADGDWHPGYFHKWMELSQMIRHSFPVSPPCAPAPVCWCDGVSPASGGGHTLLETGAHNRARPNCHLPPRLSGSSQPRSSCSASWGVLAGWGVVDQNEIMAPFLSLS